jgi:hypothetical protein
MGTAVRPAKTSPGSWDEFADVDVFVDEVLAELRPSRSRGVNKKRTDTGRSEWDGRSGPAARSERQRQVAHPPGSGRSLGCPYCGYPGTNLCPTISMFYAPYAIVTRADGGEGVPRWNTFSWRDPVPNRRAPRRTRLSGLLPVGKTTAGPRSTPIPAIGSS